MSAVCGIGQNGGGTTNPDSSAAGPGAGAQGAARYALGQFLAAAFGQSAGRPAARGQAADGAQARGTAGARRACAFAVAGGAGQASDSLCSRNLRTLPRRAAGTSRRQGSRAGLASGGRAAGAGRGDYRASGPRPAVRVLWPCDLGAASGGGPGPRLWAAIDG